MNNFKYFLVFKYFYVVGHSMFFIRFVQLQGILFIYLLLLLLHSGKTVHVFKNFFQKPYFIVTVITSENVFLLMSQFLSIFAVKSCFSFLA